MKTGFLFFIMCDFALLFFLIRSEKFQRQWDTYSEDSKKLCRICFFVSLAMLVPAVFVLLILPW